MADDWRLLFYLSDSQEHRWMEVATLPSAGDTAQIRLTMACPECGRAASGIGRVVNADRVGNSAGAETRAGKRVKETRTGR